MKIFEGVVVSTKMQNTAVVEITRKIAHPLYKKLLKRSKKHKVHTEGVSVKVGDTVKIVEVKPISKDKHFKIYIAEKKGKEAVIPEEKKPVVVKERKAKNK